MNIFKSKTLIASFCLIAIGIGFLIAEHTYYQTLDNENVLQESLFLPLGFLSLLIGGGLFLFFIIKKSWNLLSKK